MLAIAALLLVAALAISLYQVAVNGGVAAMAAQELNKWLDFWDAPNEQIRRSQCEAIINAITKQEHANEKLRVGWLWATAAQTVGLLLALVVVLLLLRP
ncbi:hypothetical protein VV01_19250 [Luteipulveratus halotolerans]|uniref:Uncharacterized protein n=1 Tax=Luteipulveratus halotolerans TaxID=1631356 RepID=A0A0L6CM19_9MICO|nr:hypothetical protein VV01_19250 [Luteipulveratus halotolerans]